MRIRGRYIAGAVGVLWTLFFLFNDSGLFAVMNIRRDTQKLTEELRKKRRVVDSLKEERRRLRTDSVYIRRAVKSRLGYIDSGEIMIRFVDEEDHEQPGK
ncbi:MAG: FtsB family cell division protein [Fibrobacterota bacterium]